MLGYEGASKALFLPPAPQGGYRKVLNISKSPLGDLGVNLTGRAFETASYWLIIQIYIYHVYFTIKKIK